MSTRIDTTGRMEDDIDNDENIVIPELTPYEAAENYSPDPPHLISKFKLCLNNIFDMLEKNEPDLATVKSQLFELDRIYSTKTSKFKDVLRNQANHYKSQTSTIREKIKYRGQVISELRLENKSLSDTIKIYDKLEKKYKDSFKEIEKLNQIIENQKKIILTGKTY